MLFRSDSTELATVTAQVLDGTVRSGEVQVRVRLSVAASASSALVDVDSGWTLLTGGLKEPVAAVAPSTPGSGGRPCTDVSVEPGQGKDCVLAFPVAPSADGTTYVTYRFAGQPPATWRLAV